MLQLRSLVHKSYLRWRSGRKIHLDFCRLPNHNHEVRRVPPTRSGNLTRRRIDANPQNEQRLRRWRTRSHHTHQDTTCNRSMTCAQPLLDMRILSPQMLNPRKLVLLVTEKSYVATGGVQRADGSRASFRRNLRTSKTLSMMSVEILTMVEDDMFRPRDRDLPRH